ncbi:hypothetical protein [Methanolobus sp. WCC5]|uniref:hypothetical protein n=1 Tax=Methanolobus sp. WCC5 TaxID=3125785 RepID=UPI00324C1713
MNFLYKLGTCLIMILLLFASSAIANSSKDICTLNITEDSALSVYSLLIKSTDKDKENVLEYIDLCELSSEKKAQLKDDLSDAWNRYPDKTKKEDYLLFEEAGTLIVETAQKTKTAKIDPVAEPLPTIEEPPAYLRYGYLLEADSKEQAVLFEYIDNCYASEKEKQEMKDSMKDIWERYPEGITEQDSIILGYIEMKTAEYLNDEYSNSGVRWNGSTHADIMEKSCLLWGVSSSYTQFAKDHADDPDDWYTSILLGKIWHSFNHYYNPYAFGGLTIGSAHMNCHTHASLAKNYYDDGEYLDVYENLAYASHFLTDLGNPMHTGHELQQINNSWVHYSYENYVKNNWDSGYNFHSTVENTNTYYVVTTPTSAIQLAQISHADLNDLFDYVYYNRYTFGDMPEVVSLTNDLLARTTKYNTGLVKYVRGKKGDWDNDGDVDFYDFVEFAAHYTAPPNPYDPLADFDEDGDVDFYDFVEFAGVYEG